VFGIGLNKTATSSLHAALTILGFRGLHDGGSDVHDAVRAAIEAERPLLSDLDQDYDAFSDIGLLSRRFGILDRQYPGSRFIFTIRPIDQWLDSRRRHVERNQARKAAGIYRGTFLVVDEPKWINEWEHHNKRVRAYFDGRPDFLEIDLTSSPSWRPICELVGRPEPDEPFPWVNRDAAVHSVARASTRHPR
jgi:hypothetical protein